ncbi:tetratricopeptide repeat protein [Chitinimonas sp. PSY-7]|uniref:tetratricopeptide repeat protein n=1 Tax=Chitinimonas sp. PSY-7 TaxID=3459088 RepID=UPI00403FFCCE
MSLLLDALKKAEEAKRLKQQASEAGDNAPTPEATPPASDTETAEVFPSLDLQPIEESSEPAAAPAASLPPAEPSYSSLSLAEPEPAPQETEAQETPPLLQDVHVPDADIAAIPGLALTQPEPAESVSISFETEEPLEPAPVALAVHEEKTASPLPASSRAAPAEPIPTVTPPQPATPAAASSPPPQTRPHVKRQSRLILIAVFMVISFCAAGAWLWWLQSQQQTSGLFAPTPAPPPETPIASTDTAQLSAEPETPAATTSPEAATPEATAAPQTAEEPVTPKVEAHTAELAKPRPARTPKPPQPSKPKDRASIIEPIPSLLSGQDVRFVRTPPQTGVAVLVSQAYQAFEQGDYVRAGQLYRQQLGQEPKNRDALLGLAAVALKQGRFGDARAIYQRLLSDNPHDALAQAALASLAQDNGTEDSESRLKHLYAERPGADVAAAMGSLLAKQGRWREAQDYYFKAHNADPEQPDHAYNLAVSLDALGERRLASTYYQRALDLAEKKPASFDLIAAVQRLKSLGSP